jgi:hypothetical protein
MTSLTDQYKLITTLFGANCYLIPASIMSQTNKTFRAYLVPLPFPLPFVDQTAPYCPHSLETYVGEN